MVQAKRSPLRARSGAGEAITPTRAMISTRSNFVDPKLDLSLHAVYQESSVRATTLNRRIEDLLTVEQAASMLGISAATLWRWKAQGSIRSISVLGRTVFDREQIEALARKRRA